MNLSRNVGDNFPQIKYISNLPVPYVVAMLNEISKECSVKAIFKAETNSNHNVKLYTENTYNFDIHFISKGKINDYTINPTILKYINRQQKMLIMTCYTEMTEMLGFIWAKIFRIPYYLEVDGGQLHPEGKMKYLIKKFLIRGAKGYISSGKTTDEYLIHYGVQKGLITRYHFTSLFKRDILKEALTDEMKKKIRQKLSLNGERVVISVGRYIYRDRLGNEYTDESMIENKSETLKLVKGFDVLIKAFSKLSDKYQLVIIGGKPNKEISELISRLDASNITFVDFKKKDELFEYYQASDLFCLQTRDEPWGLVVNEAMANGLPIITTTKCVSGLELVKDGVNGYIIDPEDEVSLKNYIEYILENESVRMKMAKASLERIAPYTIEDIAETHIKLLRNMN